MEKLNRLKSSVRTTVINFTLRTKTAKNQKG